MRLQADAVAEVHFKIAERLAVGSANGVKPGEDVGVVFGMEGNDVSAVEKGCCFGVYETGGVQERDVGACGLRAVGMAARVFLLGLGVVETGRTAVVYFRDFRKAEEPVGWSCEDVLVDIETYLRWQVEELNLSSRQCRVRRLNFFL